MKTEVTYDAAARTWTLTRDHVVEFEGRRFIIPAGFETDLASVPRFFWRFLAPFELSLEAPIAHDFLYRRGGHASSTTWLDRARADALLYELSVRNGVPAWKAAVAWRFVRWFGRSSWKGD